MDYDLSGEARDAWKIYDVLARETFIARPSIPILYFGDAPRYLESKKLVVTVGLNPSDREFRDNEGTYEIGFRFPHAAKLQRPRVMNEQFCRDYLYSLNRYFEVNPYWTWRRSYVPLLNALGTDYGPNENMEGYALHTDLCSPLATSPTWGRLGRREKNMMLEEGSGLWSRLVSDLQPDVMLVSVSKDLQRILQRFPPEKRLGDLFSDRPHKRVGTYRTQIRGKRCIVAMGSSTDRGPFSGLTNKEKQGLASKIEGIESNREPRSMITDRDT